MSKACTYSPKKGVKTFYSLKKEFGYDLAWQLYGIANNSKFKEDYKDSLRLDSEGVPSFDSIINNDYIVNILGNKLAQSLEKKFPIREDNIENYYLTLQDAKKFNEENNFNKYFIATVGYSEKDNLKIILVPKDEASIKKFSNQYAVATLNKKLSNILSSLGVNIGLLSDIEKKFGRVGVTDFSIAKNLALDSISMIRIANNMEGANALSEEFAHLIIGAMKDTPLMKRNITSLQNEKILQTILKDQYQDVYDFYNGNLELIAEEALGHILQEKLLQTEVNQNLEGRLIKYVQNQFKPIKEDDISKAISEAENSMSTLASNIFSGAVINKQDIIKSQRDVQFNALSDRIERNTKLLQNAIAIESKRLKIAGDREKSQDYIEDIIKGIDYSLDKQDTALGIMFYANSALYSLKTANESLAKLNTMSSDDRFKLLRGIKSTIQSYSVFLDDLNNILLEEKDEEDNIFDKEITFTDVKGNTQVMKLSDVLNDLNNLYREVGSRYLKVSIPAFAEYLKPILGEKVTVEMGKRAGTKITVEELLKVSDGDISYLDRWLDSMGNSSDILLRAFDKVYKNAMNKARLDSRNDIKELQVLRLKAESLGIKDFEWMFERYSDGTLTGNYISEINNSQYKRDLTEFEEQLSKKYGINAKGENFKKKQEERNRWHKTHSKVTIFGELIAGDSYRNKDFQNLTESQKKIREEILTIKKKFDERYPQTRVDTNKAIQLRKDGVQRFIDTSKSPSTILDNIKGHLAEEFLERNDDDSMFGSRSGLTDFAGREFMLLPVLFTNRLENPNELSTDIFGSLMAYAAATNNYTQIDNIIDPLEVGRDIVRDVRKIKTLRGGQNVSEKFTIFGRTFNMEVMDNGTNIEKRLDDFFESQIYHKYLKDSGVINILDTKINKNKVVSWIMKSSSLAQLGFNYLTNLANVTTGVAMQNIEAYSGQYFKASELFKADKVYSSNISSYLAELESRNKTSKLALFEELFDIRNSYDNITNNSMRKGLLARIFNSEIAYLGQSAGDHWLYNRTAIAMALREKVIVPNKGEMSLWDALEIIDVEGSEGKVKKMILPEGTKFVNPNIKDIGDFSRRVAHVNQSLFGIYNTDDREAAQRVITGRLLMQYRRWMKPQFNRRFQKAQLNLDTGDIDEGYYRTSTRILIGLIKGQYKLAGLQDKLTKEEKYNIRRTIAELAQLIAIVILVEGIKWPDDKNRPYAIKLAEYSARRLQHELGTLAPSPIMLQEMLKTVKSPAASITQVQNLTNLFCSLMDPRDWTDEIERGKYKGMSTIQKRLLNSGLPVISQYKQINRLIYDVDNAVNYYARP